MGQRDGRPPRAGYESWPTDDLIRLVAVGGGIDLDATTRLTEDLIRIAEAANIRRATVIFRGLKSRPVDDVIRIVAAGKGCVALAD
jgi:hypothetical protein